MKALVLAAMAVCLAGCTSPRSTRRDERSLLASGEYRVIEGLRVPAEKGPAGCGAEALAAAYGYLDPSVSTENEAAALDWSETGATPVDVLLAARKRGFNARVAKGSWDLVTGGPHKPDEARLVLFDTSYSVWTPFGAQKQTPVYHWSMVSGASLDGDSVLLASTDAKHYIVKRELFMERWESAGCCLIVVSPPAQRRTAVTSRPQPLHRGR